MYIQCIGPAHCKFMRWYSGNRNRVKTYGAEAVDVGWIWGKHLYAARIAQKVNPLPTLFSCGRIGCAEAPEIVPEGPGYRC